ncbi:MAG: dTDP-4-amino-4,6-dideoxygalactose transaminase [Tenuifilum sp.]|uniref:dTDP-4-amino-4,6-dideoxygalactose transaminase n=1 Tax=Tenuifilum sp. TaxID=2760880 RepID=UPI0030A40129
MINFNKPFVTGKELLYIEEALKAGKLSGNGVFTSKCQNLLCEKYQFGKTLLTSSCTDALEMAAILSQIKQGDEVIIPSFTFVSTALAFVRQGAKIVFADSSHYHPNINADSLEELITPRTKAIAVVHYAGVACDMEKIESICRKHNLILVEDSAQAIDSYYKDRALGTIGDFACFSFHETKNIISGEGGALVVNNAQYNKRAEIIWEKGTNRTAFFRGEVNKYGWVDIGSSFLPSEITAAFLYAQLQNIELIQEKRINLWNRYYQNLSFLQSEGYFDLPYIPKYSTNNAHMFYLVCKSLEDRTNLISYLKKNEIMAVFHYQSLHKSPFYVNKHDGRELPNSDWYSDCLLRLPLYYELSFSEVDFISERIIDFFKTKQ